MNEPERTGSPAESPESIAARADELLDRRRIDSARAILQGAIVQHPNHGALLLTAARAEMLDGKNDRARGILNQLLSSDPHNQGARLFLFFIELDEGRLQPAEELILGLLRASPKEAVYYAYYARLMLRALDFKKARQLADEAVRFDPRHDTCLHVKALCDIADGQTGSNSPALIRLLAQSPDDVRTLRLVVVALVHANRSREALRLAQELLRAQPDDPDLLVLVKELHQNHHWSMLPLWPMRRWGYAGSIGTYIGMLLISQTLARVAPDYRGAFVGVWLAFVVYSWAWPPLLSRWYARGLK